MSLKILTVMTRISIWVIILVCVKLEKVISSQTDSESSQSHTYRFY